MPDQGILPEPQPAQGPKTEPVLVVRDLRKWFPVRRGLLGWGAKRSYVKAVDGVSFTLGRGEALAVVGESGSGKTTTVKTLLRLIEPTSGQVLFAGEDFTRLSRSRLKAMRRHLQLIFQDPYESLNPRQNILQAVMEPLVANGIGGSTAKRRRRVVEALEETGLKPAERFLTRYPHELSGGQRQRVAIAAALVMRPQVIIADEPVSMLDASRRVEIIQLLRRLREERDLSYLIITHDLSIARYLCDRIMVMYLGQVMESAPSETLLGQPAHPYTRGLLEAVPRLGADSRRPRIVVQGEMPNPAAVPKGCRFHPRCPWRQPICESQEPAVLEVAPGHRARCHFAGALEEVGHGTGAASG